MQTPPGSGRAAYEEIEEVGQGAYGAAMRVKRRKDGQTFVVKKIGMRNIKSPKEEREVRREVMVMRLLASKCDHANIIAYYDAFFEEQTLHIVLDRAHPLVS